MPAGFARAGRAALLAAALVAALAGCEVAAAAHMQAGNAFGAPGRRLKAVEDTYAAIAANGTDGAAADGTTTDGAAAAVVPPPLPEPPVPKVVLTLVPAPELVAALEEEPGLGQDLGDAAKGGRCEALAQGLLPAGLERQRGRKSPHPPLRRLPRPPLTSFLAFAVLLQAWGRAPLMPERAWLPAL